MADHPSPDPGTDDTVGPGDPAQMPGMPRWVKISLIVALVAVLLVVILLLSGGHGPGRHLSGEGPVGGFDLDSYTSELFEGTATTA